MPFTQHDVTVLVDGLPWPITWNPYFNFMSLREVVRRESPNALLPGDWPRTYLPASPAEFGR